LYSRIKCVQKKNKAGKWKLWSWLQPLALEFVCNVIDKEMDPVAKEDILSGLADISPDFIKSWMVTNASERAPILTEILFREVQTSLAKEQNKRKCPDSVCFYHHSCNCIPLSYGADV
jgi:hypothetical protein